MNLSVISKRPKTLSGVGPRSICLRYIRQNLYAAKRDESTHGQLDTANDGGLKYVFQASTLGGFWIKARKEYPELATKANKTLLLFPTSYLCEIVFLAMTTTKAKLKSGVDVANT